VFRSSPIVDQAVSHRCASKPFAMQPSRRQALRLMAQAKGLRSTGEGVREASSVAGSPKVPMSRFEQEDYINDRYSAMEERLKVRGTRCRRPPGRDRGWRVI
jgi:hypothetical protein